MSDKKENAGCGDLYTEYYKITGMRWAKFYNKLDSQRERIRRKKELMELGHICKWFERLFADDYVKITYDTKKYLAHKTARTLKRVIYDYLLIFDFISAFYYMDLYASKRYRKYAKYLKMKNNLEDFLQRIKARLADRKDVVVFWSDCISYYELGWFPQLNKKRKTTYFFEYAYTPTPFTTPSMFAMTNKWMNIDDHAKYDIRNLSYDNSLLLGKVNEYGYEAKYFSGKDRHCVFEEKIRRQNEREFISSCRLCFDALNELVMSGKKQFMIIHAITETHYPFWHPDRNGIERLSLFAFDDVDFSKEDSPEYLQARNAAKYWDEQLDFYSDLMGNSISKIYMSDHGKYYRQYQYRHWMGMRHHIFFILESKFAPAKKETRIFSLENFSELIEAVMEAQRSEREIELKKVFDKPYVRVQEADIYLKGLVNKYKAMGYKESAKAYRGILTREDYYLRFRDHELYYRDGDEEKNLIDSPEFSDRINELRALAGDYFINLDNDKKFRYARELYQ